MDNTLYQKLGRMEAEISNIRERLDTISAGIAKIDLTNLEHRVTTLETHSDNRNERIRKLEDNQSKIVWAILLAVVGAILKLIFIK